MTKEYCLKNFTDGELENFNKFTGLLKLSAEMSERCWAREMRTVKKREKAYETEKRYRYERQ